jgi:hypothetical protein
MIISHVKIISFQLSLFCKNYRFSKTVLYIINRKIHGCLEIPDLFLVLNMISHLFAALTHEISCSTLEINLVFPHTHVLFSMYYAQENAPLLAQMWCIFPRIIQISIGNYTVREVLMKNRTSVWRNIYNTARA